MKSCCRGGGLAAVATAGDPRRGADVPRGARRPGRRLRTSQMIRNTARNMPYAHSGTPMTSVRYNGVGGRTAALNGFGGTVSQPPDDQGASSAARPSPRRCAACPPASRPGPENDQRLGRGGRRTAPGGRWTASGRARRPSVLRGIQKRAPWPSHVMPCVGSLAHYRRSSRVEMLRIRTI